MIVQPGLFLTVQYNFEDVKIHEVYDLQLLRSAPVKQLKKIIGTHWLYPKTAKKLLKLLRLIGFDWGKPRQVHKKSPYFQTTFSQKSHEDPNENHSTNTTDHNEEQNIPQPFKSKTKNLKFIV